MDRHHGAERAEYLECNPRTYDGQGRETPWAGAAGWTALLSQQDRERKTPALWRERVDPAALEPVEPTLVLQRPLPQQPPTVHRRQPTPEDLLSARQTSEREAYLAQHPRPAQSGQAAPETPWKGLAGWTALLARHEQEHRDLTSTRSAELRDLEQRHAAARDDYLARFPRPRHDGIAWAGAEGWASLLETQAAERKRVAGTSSPVLASIG